MTEEKENGKSEEGIASWSALEIKGDKNTEKNL